MVHKGTVEMLGRLDLCVFHIRLEAADQFLPEQAQFLPRRMCAYWYPVLSTGVNGPLWLGSGGLATWDAITTSLNQLSSAQARPGTPVASHSQAHRDRLTPRLT